MMNQTVNFARSVYWYLRFSGECYGCYRGIFETFEQAIAAAPKNSKIGYNYPELAKEYQTSFGKEIASYDYPMLFWLKELLKEDCTLFDFGGNVGIHFYSYERYLSYPHNLKWVVCDLPAIVKAGEELVKQENRTELSFTTMIEQAEKADIFMASGSVQYLGSLSASLAKLTDKPKHLLINRLPLCQGKTFVTLQNGGLVLYPLYVFNRQEFIDSICGIGYRIIDTWKDRSEPCAVPFHPEFNSLTFNGLYFKL